MSSCRSAQLSSNGYPKLANFGCKFKTWILDGPFQPSVFIHSEAWEEWKKSTLLWTTLAPRTLEDQDLQWCVWWRPNVAPRVGVRDCVHTEQVVWLATIVQLHLTVIMKYFCAWLYSPYRTRIICGTPVPDVNSFACIDGLFGCFMVNDFANLLTQDFKRNLIFMESECVWY